MSKKCPGTWVRDDQPESRCELHPKSKYPAALGKDDPCRTVKIQPPPITDSCEWTKYLLYGIPILLYLPWAIGKVRCCPKCCPPPECCPQTKPTPKQNECCIPDPLKCPESYQPKQKKDPLCGKEKKACDEE